MNHASSFLVWVQWLSDHSLAVTLAMALVAVAIEGLWRVRERRANQTRMPPSPGVTDPWASTWLTNGALLACAVALSWLLSPWLSPVFSDALSGRMGLLAWLGADQFSFAIHVILGILLLDLLTYGLHRVMHAVPILWRVHQVHHSDTEMNASTQFRQHPLQLIATLAMQLPLVWLLGIPGFSWVLYAVLSAAVELWHHSTIRLPTGLDRWLSFVVVTPQFHRTHHHPERRFHDANYGAVFPLWDHLLGTVASAPVNATTGLNAWMPDKTGRTLSLATCLLMPFQRARAAAVPSGGKLAATMTARKHKAQQKFQTIDGGKS